MPLGLAPYENRNDGTSSKFWILVLLGRTGTWEKPNWHLPDDVQQAIEQKVVSATTTRRRSDQPLDAETKEQLKLVYKINRELTRPGTDLEARIILRSAEGDLEKVLALEKAIQERGIALPLHSMAIVAVENVQPSIVQFCVDRNVTIDADISNSAVRALNSDVLKILWSQNILKVQTHPEAATFLLLDLTSFGIIEEKWLGDPSNNPDAISLARLLLEKGAKVDREVIQSAVRYQSLDFVKLLLSHCPDNVVKNSGLLHRAAKRGVEWLALFLSYGLDINESCKDDLYGASREPGPILEYPLYHAVYSQQFGVAEELLKLGAETSPKIYLVQWWERGESVNESGDVFDLLDAMERWDPEYLEIYVKMRKILETHIAKL